MGWQKVSGSRQEAWMEDLYQQRPCIPGHPSGLLSHLTVCSTTGVDRRCRLPKGDEEKCGW